MTAGTLFEATKLPLTVWFQGIYFMTQGKKGVSAMTLHRQIGISYNAAWRMRHKVMQVMMERDRDHPLGGERSGGKRGRGRRARPLSSPRSRPMRQDIRCG